MAINPNTDFSSGAVLTAAQQNRFPRGIMSYVKQTGNVGFGGETTIITATAFTAVANRYYRIIFFQPAISNTGVGYSVMRIKNGATTLNLCNAPQYSAGTGYVGQCEGIFTFAAGSTTITGTLVSTASGTSNASATQFGFLSIEDIGPA
jgi:hypothetical protein